MGQKNINNEAFAENQLEAFQMVELPLDEKIARSVDKINGFGDRFRGAEYFKDLRVKR